MLAGFLLAAAMMGRIQLILGSTRLASHRVYWPQSPTPFHLCSSKKLGELLSYARVKPAVNQIESHPFWRNEKTIDFCKSNVRCPDVLSMSYLTAITQCHTTTFTHD